MSEEYVCQPQDIDASGHLFDAFDHNETEVSAGWIVRFCQQRGKGWEPFTYEDIDGYYKSRGLHDGFWFNRLVPERYIINKGNVYHITPRFVACCYKSSPVKKPN